MNLRNKNILFIVPPKDYRDEELIEPRRLLESYNAKTFISSKNVKESKGILGSRIAVNLDLEEVKVSEYDAIVFVGGIGSKLYWEDKTAINIAKEAKIKGKIVSSICLATGILANAGLLKGIKAAGWEDTKSLVEKNGGTYTENGIEVSSRIITAQGPKYAKEFGEAIAKALAQIKSVDY